MDATRNSRSARCAWSSAVSTARASWTIPLFGDQATDEFDNFILRSNFNDGWTWGGTQAQFIRDQFADQSLLAMMSTASPGSTCTCTSTACTGASTTQRNDLTRHSLPVTWAVTRTTGTESTPGHPVGDSNMQPWYDLMNFNFDNGSTAAYQRVQGNYANGTDDPAVESLLDVPNYIDYMLVNFFVCNADWPGHNWYTARPRGAASAGFKFFPWDTEMATGLSWIRDPAGDRTGVGAPDSNNVSEPYYWLSMNCRFPDALWRSGGTRISLTAVR